MIFKAFKHQKQYGKEKKIGARNNSSVQPQTKILLQQYP